MQLKMVAEVCENDGDILNFLFLKLSRLDPNIGSNYSNLQMSISKDVDTNVFESFLMRCLNSVDPKFFDNKFLCDVSNLAFEDFQSIPKDRQIEVHTHKFLQIWAHITEYYEDILNRDLTKVADCCINISKLFDNNDSGEMVKVLFIVLNLAIQSSNNFSFLTDDIPPNHEDIFQKWLQRLFAIPKYEHVQRDECDMMNGEISRSKAIELEFDIQRMKRHLYYYQKQCYSLSKSNMELETKFKELYAVKDENARLSELNSDLTRQYEWEKKKRMEAEKSYKDIFDEYEEEIQKLKKFEYENKLLSEKLDQKDDELESCKSLIVDLRFEITHHKKIYDESITDGAVSSSNLNDSGKVQIGGGERLSDSVLKGVTSMLANKENEQPHSSSSNNSFQSPTTVRHKEAMNFISNIGEEQSKMLDDLHKANTKINELEMRIVNFKRDIDLREREMAQSRDITSNLEKELEKLIAEKDKLINDKNHLDEEYRKCEDTKNKLEDEKNKLSKKLEEALREKEQIPTKLDELNETLNEIAIKVKSESIIYEESDDSTGRLVTQNNFILKTLITILFILIFFPITLVYTCRLYNLPLFEVFSGGMYFSSSSSRYR
uniref:HOOK_N domain-containing protein n=1 Tax=Strongyloides papillosus TaxID=174720 RepID=A0A0N5BKK7_STREA